MRRSVFVVVGTIAIAATTAFTVQRVSAAEFPTKPLRFLVGFAPGGGADILARALSGRLSDALGQQIIVDNRPGAGGNIATAILARSEPDGHTLLMGSLGSLAISPTLYANLPFNVSRDLAPVVKTADATNLLCVFPGLGATSVRELVALAKSRSLSAGSAGVGSAGHLAMVLFNLMAGTKIVHVPYKGGGQAIIDLAAGNIHVIFSNPAAAMSQVKAGRVKAIAVTTAQRLQLMPELPTVSESGVPGYEANNWTGVVVPAGTPRNRIDRLNREIAAILRSAEMREILSGLALEPSPGTPEQFAAYIRSETVKWARVAKASGAKGE